MYALLLIALLIVCSSAIAKSKVFYLVSEMTSVMEVSHEASSAVDLDRSTSEASSNSSEDLDNVSTLNPAMFMTIIQGANEEVICPNDGSTLAKFYLCGTSDVRTVTLSQNGSSYQWQKLDPNSCAATVVADCPTSNPACTWNTVATTQTYNLNSAGEFRVRVDSGQYFYFKSTLNPLDPQLIKEDIICGNPGRVEVTNVPAGYEYSLNSSTGPFQDDPFFDITAPGNYTVWVRLKNAGSSSCLFPSNTVTVSDVDITVDVTTNDILCSGEQGSITTQVFGVPGFYTYRLIKGGVTVDTFGPDSASTYTFANVGTGTYSVRVETNKCNELVTLDVNSNPIQIGSGISPLAVSATASDSFGCGASSIDVTINTSGGTAPYRYSLDGGANYSPIYDPLAVFTVTTPGTYNILVEDANGCTKSASVALEDLPPPDFNVTTQDANCGGANNGQLTVNVTNGYGYNLEFSINNGVNYQNPNVFTNLAPGSYDVVIRYQQGSFTCTTTPVSASIGTPSTINGSATADTSPTCANPNGGQITVSGVSGGIAPYEYSVGAGFGAGTVFTNLGVGTYTPQIRDANGCVETLPAINFSAFNGPTDMSFTISSIDCTTSTATVDVAVTGGTAPFTYEITAPAGSVVNNGPSNSFANLGLGTYTFRVTDSSGCFYDENFAITDISSITASAQATDVVTCVGDSDGAGRFLIDGFATTYSYSIDGGPVTTGETNGLITLGGLTAGNYVITVTDEDTNCTDTATLVIEEPVAPLAIDQLNVTPMTCQNNNTGAVTIVTSGGWGGSRYTLIQPDSSVRGPQSGSTFTNLTLPGTYQVSVSDANGCTLTGTFDLVSQDSPTLTLDNGASDFCYDNVDAATLVVNTGGGTAPYQYRINAGPWVGGSTFSGVTPGTYTIDVIDANDCIDTVTATIAPEITAVATTTQELTCGGPDAEILVNISNGYPSGGNYDVWEVSINGAPFTSNANNITGNSFVYSIPNDGSITAPTTFLFLVSDSQGCTTETNVVTIEPTETIFGTAVPTDTTCGADNGIIELVPDTNFGVPPYQFSDNGGATFTNQNIYSGFAPGTYGNFMIRDSRGCPTALLSATIASSTPIDAAVTATPAACSGGVTEGSIDVTNVSNGTADFTYTLQDAGGNTIAVVGPTSSTTANFPNLPQGNYTVITTDSAGCQDTDFLTITEDTLTIVPNDNNPPDCTTDLTNTITIVGGVGPFLIKLVGEPGPRYSPNTGIPPTGNTRVHTFTGLNFGTTYYVEIEDTATGCIYIEEIPPVTGPSPLTVTATATSASCDVAGNGILFYEIDGYTSTLVDVTVTNTDTGVIIFGTTITVTFPGGPYNDQISNLPPGNYQILVEDNNNGCSAGALETIVQDIPTLVVDDNTPASCNAGAFVTVRGNGGTPAYGYAFVPAGDPAPGTFTTQTTYEIAGPYPADYDFYIQDSNGCTSFTTVTVTQAAGVPTPTVDVANQCTAQSNYTIDVTSPLSPGSGLPEETFEYNIGGGYQTSPNFTVPNPGDYTITVRDGNGCTNTVLAQVFDFFAISASATTEPTCNAGDGVITVNTTGGSGNFRYELDDGTNPVVVQVNDPVFTNLSPGNYSILVTDLSSNTIPLCNDTTTVDVTIVDTPVISATPKGDITCFGADDGYISIELQPGTDTDGPFTYILYDGGTTTVLAGPQGASVFDDLAPGTYQVEVVSDRGCTDRSGDVEILEPTQLLINTTNTEFTCDPNSNRFNTANITVYTDSNGDGTGVDTGTAPYTYTLFDGVSTISNGTNNVFEVVDNGTNQTFTLTARDQNGCENSTDVTINAPTDITFTINVNNITCDTDGISANPGSIEIIIDQGPGSYDVEILPFGSEPVRNSGGSDRVIWDISIPGDYIFAVTDVGNAGCTYLTPVINVPEYNTIEALIAEVKPVTCFNGSDGEISIQINNYTGAYNYEVFSRDNSGVETTTGVTGSFDTTVPGENPGIITGVPAGNLVVHVEALGTPFCDAISNVATVRQPNRALTVALQQTADVTCAVPGLGEIFAAGDGGWGSYEYQLIDPDGTTIIQDFPDTNDTFSGLDNGTYTVNVRDAEGCIATNTINLALPTPIYADIQVTTPLQCNNDNNGAIEAFNVSGGQGPGNYLYQLNRLSDGTSSGLQTTATFSNLSAGDYTITVFDGWDCSYITVPITIDDPEIVIAELIELQPPGCGDVGIMELTITNPEPGVSYFYRRTGSGNPFVAFDILDPTATSVQISENITIDPGPFQYNVQNSNGCPFEKSNQISLDPAAPLAISLDLANATINCNGEATGIIRSEAFGGIGNYVYTLLNSNTPPFPAAGNTERSAQASGIFRDLGPGTYYVYVQSGGCTAISPPIDITEPPPLVLNYLEAVPISCFGDTDGQIIIEASGGTGAIRYAITDNLSEFFEGDDPMFPNRKTFTDLAPASYEIIIQDELGCTIIQTISITEPTELVAGIADSTPETCLGEEDGSVTLQVNGGTPPYEFALNSSDDADFAPNPGMFFDNLRGGETYVIFIRDSRGCITNVIVSVEIGVDIEPLATVSYGCDGIFPNSTVTVDVADSSQLPRVLFALDPADPTDANTSQAGTQSTWGDLPAGDHSVYLYHENGCTTFVEFTIEAYEPLTLDAVKTGPNEITATASGGFGGYQYSFQEEPFGPENVYTINEDASVTITAIDQNGCEVTITIPFEFTGMLEIPNFFTPDGDNNNDVWFPRNRDFFPNIEVKIYDRYGRVVAILDQTSAWDGTYEGNELPSGDYWYVVNANDEGKQQYVGHFTLYRQILNRY